MVHMLMSVKINNISELKLNQKILKFKIRNTFFILIQGSHRSGNSGKILKTFSSQGNQ